MNLLKIIRNTVCGGAQVAPGDIVEASDQDSRVLLGIEKAVKATEKEIKKYLKAKADAEAPAGDQPAGSPDAPPAEGTKA